MPIHHGYPPLLTTQFLIRSLALFPLFSHKQIFFYWNPANDACSSVCICNSLFPHVELNITLIGTQVCENGTSLLMAIPSLKDNIFTYKHKWFSVLTSSPARLLLNIHRHRHKHTLSILDQHVCFPNTSLRNCFNQIPVSASSSEGSTQLGAVCQM